MTVSVVGSWLAVCLALLKCGQTGELGRMGATGLEAETGSTVWYT